MLTAPLRALLRGRMLPLMILAVTIEQGRKGIALINPILSSDDGHISPGFWINWLLSAALLASLALSLLKVEKAPARG